MSSELCSRCGDRGCDFCRWDLYTQKIGEQLRVEAEKPHPMFTEYKGEI